MANQAESAHKPPASVPYIAFESLVSIHERHIKRLILALLISVCLLAASNAAWLYAWCQYDYSSEESQVLVDGKNGIANYIGNSGDIYNGESVSEKDGEAED